MLHLISLLIVLACFGQQPQPRDAVRKPSPGTAVVRGVVVDEPTKAPISGARVRLSISGDDAWTAAFSDEVRADAGGAFEFTHLPAGDYVLSVFPGELRATHLPTIVGHEGPGPYLGGRSFALIDGEERTGLTVALKRAGAIEGRVLNEYGEPMANVEVMAKPLDFPFAARSVRTDDRGQFRIFALDQQGYTICAEPGVAGTHFGEPSAGDAVRLRYSRACSPDPVVPGVAQAPMVILQTARTGALAIHGTIVTTAPAQDSWLNVRIIPVAPDARNATAPVERSGNTFSARGLMPGPYLVRAYVTRVEPHLRQALETGEVMVTIGDAEVHGVTITTLPYARVTGRIVQHPDARGRWNGKAQVQVLPAFDRMRFSDDLSVTNLASDGTFTLDRVSGPGAVRVSALPRGWFVHSVRYGEQDITNRLTVFAHDDPRMVQVLVSDRGATLSVRPVDAQGATVSSAQVLLIPADPERQKTIAGWGEPLKRGDGTAEFSGCRPGEYLLLAISAAEWARLWNVHASLKPFIDGAQRVTLAEGADVRMDLKVFNPVTR